MDFNLDYLGNDRWLLTVTYPSGRRAVRDGGLDELTRLALRAERLLSLWAQSRASKTTIPAAPATIPVTPSGVKPRPLKSTLRAQAEELKKKHKS